MSEEQKFIACIPAGQVEYDEKEAATHIDDIISMLTEMKDDGVTHVVLESGNHRGPQWMNFVLSYEWVDQ
jgi:hypothetical protein